MVVLLTAILLFSSCEYKDLCYNHNHWSEPNLSLELNLNLDLNVELDVSEAAHTKIDTPTYMVVAFYDPEDGSLRKTEFTGPFGGPLQVNPGNYNMVVYSFDTEWTQVRGESNVNILEAFTSDISALKLPLLAQFYNDDEEMPPGPIIYTPDHLLVTQKDVEIPPYSEETHVITITATANTIVETYAFEVRNIQGIEYIASVEAFITNQARSSFFGRGEKGTEPATIYFPMEVDRTNGELKSTFNTFGKLPGESHSYLHMLLYDTQGNPFTITDDITEQFYNPDHVIVIEDSVVIPEPQAGGGGIAPTVDPWEEVNQDVPIG